MDDIVIEIPFNQEEDFYIICHYCNILKKKGKYNIMYY